MHFGNQAEYWADCADFNQSGDNPYSAFAYARSADCFADAPPKFWNKHPKPAFAHEGMAGHALPDVTG